MIKKSILALLAALFLLNNAANVRAQKIYLITGGDILDDTIGIATMQDISKFASLFSYFEPDKQVVYYNQTQSWTGPDIFYSGNVKEAVLTAIRNCPATPSDKIVFYWSGHGAYNMNGHYLYLPKGSVPRVMFRSEIMYALQQKGASLTVLITDSCHDFHETPPRAPCAPCAPAAEADGFVEKYEGIPPLFRSLFFNCNGVVDINSSSPNEKSYCTIDGSFFTASFVGCVSGNLDNNMGWEVFLNGVQNCIQKENSYLIKDEAPFNQNNLTINQNIHKLRKLPPKPEFQSMSWKIVQRDKRPGERSPFIPIFAPRYIPQFGDRIISVNGVAIGNEADFRREIGNAQTHITFTLFDHRMGRTMNLTTDLNPPGSYTRLGIYIRSDVRGGVMVLGVIQNSPGTRCYIDNNDIFSPVDSVLNDY